MNEKNDIIKLIDIYYESWFKINFIYHTWAKEHGVQDTSVFVMYIIHETSPYCTQTELCNRLFLPKQTVFSILSELEKKGYISKELNPKDRRNKIIKFTDQGTKYANDILKELKAAEIRAFSNMTKEQIKSMVESFNLLSDLLTKSFSE